MTQITIKGKNNKLVKDTASKMLIELENIFGIKLNDSVTINLHQNRNSYNKKLGRVTRDWEVGNMSNYNVIDILHPDSFEKFSSHKKDEFNLVLKHELVHIFIGRLSKSKTIPMWLNEGLANYVAGYISSYTNSGPLYIEQQFLEKLSTQFSWNQHASHGGYRYSSLFIDHLIKKYSISHVLDLIRNSKKFFEKDSFGSVFSEIFKQSIEKEEEVFIKEITK